jgi:hypothetical protein
MIGMYEVERSGETERIRMRGSRRVDELAGVSVEEDGWITRLMSISDEIELV